MSRFIRLNRSALLAIALMTLAMRMAVPAGWMPARVDGKAAIMLCTGTGMAEAWVDAEGKIHKQNPAEKRAGDQPCAFAALGSAAAPPALGHFVAAPLLSPLPSTVFIATNSAVGHGLAAPPPPAIGPPPLT